MNCTLFIVLGLITLGATIEIKKCKLPDPDCIRESAQEVIRYFGDGIPEYNVEPFDPLTKDELDMSTSTLNTTLRNIKATGLKHCKIIRMNLDQLKLSGQVECNMKIEADYEMNGQILVLSVNGKGKAHITLRKLVVNADGNIIEVTGKDGKKHWKIKTFTHSYELRDKCHIKFDNLFNGNLVLGRAANDLFESSPNEILLELAPPFVTYVAKLSVEKVNHFFHANAIEDLTL